MKNCFFSLLLLFSLSFADDLLPEFKSMHRSNSNTLIEAFLDSVGSLALEPLMNKSSAMPDSIFYSQTQLNQKLSFVNILRLKRAAKRGSIDKRFAKSLLNDLEIDSSQVLKNKISVKLYSFNNFKEFALSFGGPEYAYECDLYFFKSRTLIAKHHIYHRYGLQIEHYQDENGKMVVYYKENFTSGSGICWYNYYFYQFSGLELIPILNILETSNLCFPWGNKAMYFGTEIIDTNPLLLRIDYAIDFCLPYPGPNFISSIDTIPFNWDKDKKALSPDYSKSKLSETRILSYYLVNNELLFIRSYYDELIKSLQNNETRESSLNYLDSVMKTK